jgi:hypothetical protein
MKKTTPLWLSALLTTLPGLLYCGGDTTDSGSGSPAATTGSGGSSGSGTLTGSGTGGSSTGQTGSGTTTASGTGTGAGGDMTTGAGTGTATGGSAGSGTGTGAGGTTTGAGGTGGTGGRGGTGGTGGTAGVDAGACPRAQPNQGAMCTSTGEVCDYTGFACTCQAIGPARDGGMARDGWNCVRVRVDAGTGTPDASACPRVAPGNGTACTTVGESCPYGRETCTCQMGAGGRDQWACGATPRDGGNGGG